MHVLVRGRAGPVRAPRGRSAYLREDADLRQPPRAVLRGNRAHRRAARQLPASIQPPVADQCGDQSGLPTRSPRRTGWPEGSSTAAGRRAIIVAVAPAGTMMRCLPGRALALLLRA